MKFRIFCTVGIFSLFLLGSSRADTLYHLWSQSFGDSTSQAQSATAFDGDGNVLLTGTFSGTVDLGGGALTSAGLGDVLLAKFDLDGNHLWSHSFGDPDEQNGWCVAADPDGSLLVTGPFLGTIDLGGGVLTSAGNRDIYLAKFDSDGNHIWSQSFGDPETQGSRSVIVDQAGSIVLVGNFRGSIDFGGGVLTSSGRTDVFVAKLDGDGNHLWSQGFGDVRVERGKCVAVDSDRNVHITGYFERNVNFGGGQLQSAGAEDAYLAKFDPDGVHLWSQSFGDSVSQWGESVATDDDGHVFLAGYFSGSVEFGSGVLVSAGEDDAYLAKFDPAGSCLWSQRFGDAEVQRGSSTAIDGDGNAVLAGYFSGSVDFGGGGLASEGEEDAYLAKFDPAGNYLWSQRFGDSEGQLAESVAADVNGDVLLAGYFLGSIDFGGGDLVCAGMQDIFLAKFGLDEPTPIMLSEISIIENELAVELSWHVMLDVQSMQLEIHRAVTPDMEESRKLITLENAIADGRYRDEMVAPGETYYYWIRAIDMLGEDTQYGPFIVTFAGSNVPLLLASYPNPVRNVTTVRFYLPKPGEASLRVYRASGQVVRFMREMDLGVGTHSFVWDRTDQDGRVVPKGIYFYSIDFDGAEQQEGKLTVLR